MKTAYLCQFVAHSYCLPAVSIWSESIAVPIELCFTNRFHYLKDTLLYNPVKYRGYSQRTLFPIGFWNIYPSHSLRLVVEYFIPHSVDKSFFWHLFQVLKSLSINACCIASFIVFQVAVCQFDIFLAGNYPNQVSEDFAWLTLLKQAVLYLCHTIVFRIAQTASLQFFFSLHSQHHLAFARLSFS